MEEAWVSWMIAIKGHKEGRNAVIMTDLHLELCDSAHNFSVCDIVIVTERIDISKKWGKDKKRVHACMDACSIGPTSYINIS